MKYLKLFEDFSDDWDDDEDEEEDFNAELIFNYADHERNLSIDIKVLKTYFTDKGISFMDYSLYDMTDYGQYDADGEYNDCRYELKLIIENLNVEHYYPQRESLISEFEKLPFVDYAGGSKYVFIIAFKPGVFAEEVNKL